MIIWINGAFGSGKTQAAYELQRRLTKAYVFDPEEVGFYIGKNLPEISRKSDFQDYPMWREFNGSMLSYLSNSYDGIIICPMTVTNKTYYKEMTESLVSTGVNVKHYVLSARPETILRRLRSRGEGKNSWAASQLNRCVELLADKAFQEHIETDELSIDEVVEEIARRSKLDIKNDPRSQLKKKWHRLMVMKRHIRLFN